MEENPPWKGKTVDANQTVAAMADEALKRQVETRARRTEESLDEALGAVLATEAGQQLQELRGGPHRDEKADEWQEGIARERAKERHEVLGW